MTIKIMYKGGNGVVGLRVPHDRSVMAQSAFDSVTVRPRGTRSPTILIIAVLAKIPDI